MLFVKKNPVMVFVLSWGFLTVMSWVDNYINDPRLNMIIYIFIYSIFAYSSYLLIDDFQFESSYFKHIFYVFIIYELFIIAHGFYSNGIEVFSINDIYWFIRGGDYLIWPLLIPVFVFFNKKISNFAILFDGLFLLGILALAIFPILPSIFLTRASSVNLPGLTYGCGILLLFASYLRDRRVNISLIIIIITLLSFTYLARRNNIVTIMGFIVFAYLVNFRTPNRPMIFRLFPFIIGLGILVTINFSDFTNILTERLSNRITEDSRTDVLVPFFIGMEDHEFFGKGLSGTYYSPSGGELEDEGVVFTEVEYRDMIEVGYLQLFLNGGIINVLLYLFIFVPAAINGIFKSNNLFSKACGVIIFLWLIDMFIYGLPILSFHYIFVWICIGICYKTSFRIRTDDEIRLEFQKHV